MAPVLLPPPSYPSYTPRLPLLSLHLPRFVMTYAEEEEELQRLYAADSDDGGSFSTRARPAAGVSRCPKSCDAGIMLLPLPCASEVRISVSPSTPSRRLKFFLALAAGDLAPFPPYLCKSNVLTQLLFSTCRISDLAIHQKQEAVLRTFRLDARLQCEIYSQRTSALQPAHYLLHRKQPWPIMLRTNGLGPVQVELPLRVRRFHIQLALTANVCNTLSCIAPTQPVGA